MGWEVLSIPGLPQADIPVLMGTFGKALGTFGAFIAGSETLIEYPDQWHDLTFTTALPPALASTQVSLRLVRGRVLAQAASG